MKCDGGTIVDHGRGDLAVNIEGDHDEIHVTPAVSEAIEVLGKSVYESQPDFEIEISRYRFVRDFYLSLVTFWEGEELQKKDNV